MENYHDHSPGNEQWMISLFFFFLPHFFFFFPWEIFFFFAGREGEEMEWNVEWEGTTSVITPRPALSAASRGHINLIQKK